MRLVDEIPEWIILIVMAIAGVLFIIIDQFWMNPPTGLLSWTGVGVIIVGIFLALLSKDFGG
jgi:hypothetical protein